MKALIPHLKFIKKTLLFTCILGIVIFSCKKNDFDIAPVYIFKNFLQDTINTTQHLIDFTIEGTKPGQYPAGSKADLVTKLAAAKTALANTSADQTEIYNATVALNKSNDLYQANVVKEVAVESLVAFWKMNGNANDSSGNKNNGTLTAGDSLFGAGTPAPAADRFSRTDMAYHFDKGGNIEVPYKTSLNPAELSISVWCKKETAGRTWSKDTYYLVALDRWFGYNLQIPSSAKVSFTINTTRATPIDTDYVYQNGLAKLLPSQWYHVVVTFKPDTLSFYINGSLTATYTGAKAPGIPLSLANPINLTIGQDLPTDKYLKVDGNFQVTSGGFWTGDMDDVMLYNKALNGAEVKAIFVNQNTL